ncbi:hypothetical protein AMTRI_Chr03g144140 [Amborella trichopoda]
MEPSNPSTPLTSFFSTKTSSSSCSNGVSIFPSSNETINGHYHSSSLMGGLPPSPNHLSPRQMESLTALCDTLIPSIDVDFHGQQPRNAGDDAIRSFATSAFMSDFHGQQQQNAGDDAIRSFFATSASMSRTPDHVAGLVSGKVKHALSGVLRLCLWLLSTWYGTFIICGTLSLSSHFPYFQSFPQIIQPKREEIMLSWSTSSIYLLRALFQCIKFFVHLIFYSKVDENNHNSTWQAIGYCGPDPQKESGCPHGQQESKGPLQHGVIDLDSMDHHTFAHVLRASGFTVSQPKEKFSNFTIKCDAVVVGSGSGGGVAAGVLAVAGHKVVVLEKGHYFARSQLSLLEGPTMDQMYDRHGLIATDDLSAIILAGSTVGGGSAINWSAAIRTPDHVLNEWNQVHGLELFESKAYHQAMDVVARDMGVQTQVSDEGLACSALRKGCQELGFPVVNVPRNSPDDHYCGWCCFGCKDGKKKGTGETWLLDMVNSGNGVVVSGARVVEVVQRKRKGMRNLAVGVVFERENKRLGCRERFMIVSKVTVVACGALGTPVLLKKSGLRSQEIGRNLHIHPTNMAWGYFPENRGFEKEKRSYEGGILTAMLPVPGKSKDSGYGGLIQNPALHPGMFSVVMPWMSSLDMKERMTRFSRTVHLFALVRDKGSGVVSSPPYLSYKMSHSDKETMSNCMEKMLRILAAAGAEEIGTHGSNGERINVKVASSHEFERFVREVSRRPLQRFSNGYWRPICSAHQMGTCRMGAHPNDSVVDQKGECWEVEGLYIADSSVFPTALGVNPMLTVQAIAYCTAHAALDAVSRKTTKN